MVVSLSFPLQKDIELARSLLCSSMGWISSEDAAMFEPYFDTSIGANPIELEDIDSIM